MLGLWQERVTVVLLQPHRHLWWAQAQHRELKRELKPMLYLLGWQWTRLLHWLRPQTRPRARVLVRESRLQTAACQLLQVRQ